MGDVVLEGETMLEDVNVGPHLTTNFVDWILEGCGK